MNLKENIINKIDKNKNNKNVERLNKQEINDQTTWIKICIKKLRDMEIIKTLSLLQIESQANDVQ